MIGAEYIFKYEVTLFDLAISSQKTEASFQNQSVITSNRSDVTSQDCLEELLDCHEGADSTSSSS